MPYCRQGSITALLIAALFGGSALGVCWKEHIWPCGEQQFLAQYRVGLCYTA